MQGLERDDGGRHRKREAEDDAGDNVPAHHQAHADAHGRAGNDAQQGARDGDGLHRDEVLEREIEPDAEHQEHDADLGKLEGQLDIGHEAWRMRADDDARDQVADQRRHLQPVGHGTQDEGQHETPDNRRDQRGLMHVGQLVLLRSGGSSWGHENSGQIKVAARFSRPEPQRS